VSGYINVTVVGSLGRDPEIRSTTSGKKIASFSVAVDQGYGENKKTEWVNVIAWEKLADLAEKYLKKGKQIALSGSLQTSSWEDKKTGDKKYKTEVVARDITFMDSPGGKTNDAPRPERQAPAPRQQAAPTPRAAATDNPFDDDDASDIPF
jgi:single-strand DNA-binding protein